MGITPTLAMLDAALASQRPVHFIHFARNRACMPSATWWTRTNPAMPNCSAFMFMTSTPPTPTPPTPPACSATSNWRSGFPLARDVDAYFLGPKPFMRRVKQQLRELGVPEAQDVTSSVSAAALAKKQRRSLKNHGSGHRQGCAISKSIAESAHRTSAGRRFFA